MSIENMIYFLLF